MTRQRPPILQYLLLAILFAGASAYHVQATVASFPGFFSRGAAAADWPFILTYTHGQPTATFVSPAALDAGVRDGDIVTHVNGRIVTGTAVLGEEVAKAKTGDKLQVAVRAIGAEEERTVAIPFVTAPASLEWTLAVAVMLKVVLPIVSLLLGFWVAFVRPRDITAWLLLGTLLGVASLFFTGVDTWGRGVREVAMLYTTVMHGLWPLCMLLLGLYFPEPFPPGRARAWLKVVKAVLVPLLVANAVIQLVIAIGRMDNYASVARLEHRLRPISDVFVVLVFTAVGGFFASVGAKFGMAVSADAKRRLRLLYTGTTVSMAPAFLVQVAGLLAGLMKGTAPEQVFPLWLTLGSYSLMLLFPITLAYVILVERAMDVRVVIRQGLQYALAKGGIQLLRMAIGIIVVVAIVYLVNHGGRNSSLQYIIITVSMAAWLSLRRILERLRAWIDRRFFRDAYNAEQVLANLSDEVRSIVETKPLLERVTTRIAESLHVPRIAVLLQQDGFYRPAYALGYSSEPQAELRQGASAIQRLRRHAEPTPVYFDDQTSWVNQEIPEDERRVLASLDPQLLLPLAVKDKLLGVVSLGEKRSEEPYSGTDLRLLKSVAMQTGLALANAQLTAAIAEEVASREKMNRELEIAREVQERLFPQRQPPIAGLDYFGACRTALSVGGDYYDFLPLPEGRLGIAVGDVSGKGIGSALMMASLEASLRAEAPRAGGELSSMIGRLNNMICDTSTEARYATLFYAEYDPSSGRLTYVNAGHNPPIWLRQGGACVERLDEAGGLVVGLMRDCAYQQASATLAPGDELVIFTDGISEAMDLKFNEWGEERLIAAARESTKCSAEEVINQVLESVAAHAAGAPQSDDMTLVVVRAVK